MLRLAPHDPLTAAALAAAKAPSAAPAEDRDGNEDAAEASGEGDEDMSRGEDEECPGDSSQDVPPAGNRDAHDPTIHRGTPQNYQTPPSQPLDSQPDPDVEPDPPDPDDPALTDHSLTPDCPHYYATHTSTHKLPLHP